MLEENFTALNVPNSIILSLHPDEPDGHGHDNTTTPTQPRTISLTNTQLYGAASGGHHDGCCPPVVDPYTLLALIVGIALATYFLNVLINVTMFGKRRKKREEGGLPNELHQLLLEGIEEFDEEFREDNKASDETNPWYVDTVKRLIELKEEAEDDLICDVGYDSNNLNTNMTNTIYGEKIPSSLSRCQQKLESEVEISNKMLHGKGRCTMVVWRCFSAVLENMVKYVEDPKQFFGLVNPMLYKAVFHGKHRSMWNAVMEIPELAGVARCTRDHDQCVTDRVMAEAVTRWSDQDKV